MGRHVVRVLAAVVLTAATGLVLPSAPASAAACSAAEGVTVVVDFHELGGGVQQVCDAGSGQTAAARFGDAGFVLDRVQSQPGFVCRVQGKPASDPCQRTPPSNAYWGLWWSDGKSGSWTYATQGVDSLKVPEGGYVALSWNGSSTKSPPGARPTTHQSQPSPSPSSSSPQPQPSSDPSGGGSHASPSPGTPGKTGGAVSGSPSASASGGAKPSASASRKAGNKPSASASASASASPSDDPTSSFSSSPDAAPEAAPDPADPSDGGLPAWVAPVAIGLLFAAAAGTAVVRRRRGTPGP